MTSDVESATTAFPLRRTGPVGPPHDYADWAAESPIRRVRITTTGADAVVVTRYADCRAFLEGGGTSANRLDPRFPNFRRGVFARGENTNLMFMDGEAHQRYRRMLAPEFTPKRLQMLKPRLQQFVDRSMDRLVAAPAPADLHAEFSRAIPSQMICVLLGVDYDEHHRMFEDATDVILSTRSTAEEFAAAMGEVAELMTRVVDEQVVNPGPGVVGRLAKKYVTPGSSSAASSSVSRCCCWSAGTRRRRR